MILVLLTCRSTKCPDEGPFSTVISALDNLVFESADDDNTIICNGKWVVANYQFIVNGKVISIDCGDDTRATKWCKFEAHLIAAYSASVERR